MNILFQWLNKPFPNEDLSLSHVLQLAMIGLFVAAFLYFIQPFGMDESLSNRGWIALAFGVITFVVSVLYDYLSELLGYGERMGDRLTLGIWILHSIGLLFCIALANFFFLHYYYNLSITFSGLLYMMRATFLVGIFPIVFIGAIRVQRDERKYGEIALEVKGNLQSRASSQVKYKEIDSEQILFIESVQNYIKIVFLDENGSLSHTIERATLSSAENELMTTSIIRCHRSYLVNKDKIETVTGNAQGLKLTLKEGEDVIPVSRKYVDTFRRIGL